MSPTNRLGKVVRNLALGLLALTTSLADAQTTDVPLINADILRSKFQGKWSVANERDTSVSFRRMGYSLGTHYIGDDGKLRIATHPNDLTGLGVFTAPLALSKSSVVTDIPFGTLGGWESVPEPPNIPDQSGTRQYGLLQLDSSLAFTYKAYYATSEIDYPSQGISDGSTVYGLFNVENAHHNKIAGYLGYCPIDVGCDYLSGLCGTPGLGVASGGPTLYAVHMDTGKTSGDMVTARTLLAYDTTGHQSPAWNETTLIRGTAWIETEDARGVLFSVRQGMGQIWYGEQEHTLDDGTVLFDPYNPNKGYHAETYEQQIWVYDPSELRAVLSSEREPWTPQPKEIIPLTEFEVRDARNEEVAMSYREGRLTIAMSKGYKLPTAFEAQPLMLEFKFNPADPPPIPPADDEPPPPDDEPPPPDEEPPPPDEEPPPPDEEPPPPDEEPPPPDEEPPPPSTDTPLLSAEMLRQSFQGAWGVPGKSERRMKDRTMTGSEGIHSIGIGGDLIVTTHPNDLHGLGVVRAPNKLSASKQMRDIPGGRLMQFESVPEMNNEPSGLEKAALHGVLDLNGCLAWTINVPESDNGTDYPTQGCRDQNGQHGLFRVSNSHHDTAGGYLASCPPDLGGDYLAGRCGPIGVQTASGGPALSLILMDVSQPANGQLASKTLLAYGNEEETRLPLFNGTTKIHGCAWIETDQVRGVVFAVTTGIGETWFGESVHVHATKGLLVDPYGGGVGYHSTAYAQQLWVYDPDDLRKVLEGGMAPDAPQPQNIISLLDYEVTDQRNGKVGLSFRNSRLTITLENGYTEWRQRSGAQPLVLEFRFP